MANTVTTDLQITVEAKDETTRVLKGVESSIIRFVGAVSAALATISVAIFPVKAAADFQQQLLDVAKTTNYTDAQIEQLALRMQELSTKTNVAADDLAKIAAGAGQLGIGAGSVDELSRFTETAARFASVLNVSVEDSTAGLGKISNIFGIMSEDVEKLSSTLNQVSNTSTATGNELLDIIQRIGTAGGTLNLQQATAFAAYGKDLGLTSETVGTTLNKIFLDLQSKAADVAGLIGQPVEEFADLVKTDGVAAYKLYIDALTRLDNVQRSIVSEQITGGGRIAAFVTSSINDANKGFALLDKNLGNANKGWDEGTSSIKEQERVLTGVNAQLTILKNVFVNIATVVGTKALPYVTDLVGRLQEWGKDTSVIARIEEFADGIGYWIERTVTVISKITELAGAMVPLATALQWLVGFKVGLWLLNIAKQFGVATIAAKNTAAAWIALGRANQDVAQTIASQAALAQQKASKAGRAAPNLSNLAKLAVAIDAVYSPLRAQQTALREEYVKTDSRISALTTRRAKSLTDIYNTMQAISKAQQSDARRVYNSTLRSTGDVAQAQAARTAFNQQTRAEIARLAALQQQRDAAYTKFIDGLQQKVAGISTQQKQIAQQVSKVGAPAIIFDGIAAGATKAIKGIAEVGAAFLRFAGPIATVISLVYFFLDLFGLIEPIVAGFKKLFDVIDNGEQARRDAAVQRNKELAREIDHVAEAGEGYRKLQAEQEKAANNKTTGAKNEVDTTIQAQIAGIKAANDSYQDLLYKGAAIANNVEFIESRWNLVNTEVVRLQKEIESLTDTLIAAENQGGAEEVAAQTQKRIAVLETSLRRQRGTLDSLAAARDIYEKRGAVNAEEQAKAVDNAINKAVGLGSAYSEAGIDALVILEKLTIANGKLTAAQQEQSKLEKESDASASTREAYVLAQQRTVELAGSVAVLKGEYESMLANSAEATLFIGKAVPADLQGNLTHIQTILTAFSAASETAGLVTETRMDNTKKRVAELDLDMQKLLAKQQKELSNATNTPEAAFATLFGSSDQNARISKLKATHVAERLEIQKTRDLEYQRLRGYDLQAKQAANVRAEIERTAAAVDKSTLSEEQKRVALIATVSAQKIVTTAQLDAQRQVVIGAQFNRDRVKKLFEQSLSDLASVVDEMKNLVGGLGSYFATRKFAIKVANYDIGVSKANQAYRDFQDDILTAEKERLANSGLTTKEQEEQLRIFERMLEVENQRRDARQEAGRQQLVINEAVAQLKEAQDRANESTQKGIELTEKAEAARIAGNQNQQISFGQQAAVEAEKAQIAIGEATAAYNTFKETAAQPISSPGGAFVLVSDEDVRNITEQYAKAKVAATQGQAKVLKGASEAAERESAKQSAIAEGLTKSVKELADTLNTLTTDGLGKALKAVSTELGQIALDGANGGRQYLQDLQAISKADFRGLDKFNTIVTDAKGIAAINDSLTEIGNTYVTKVVPAGESVATTARLVEESIARLKPVIDSIAVTKTDLAAIFSGDKQLPVTVEFPDAGDTLQGQLTGRKFEADVIFNAAGGTGGETNILRRASGGSVFGPGTSTSDSIMALLSHGEYVSDARTASFFGHGFFDTLRKIANGGVSATSGFAMKMLGGLQVPAFASGGPVLPGMLGLGSGIANALAVGNGSIIDRVAVDLNVAGQSVELLGDRKQVDRFVKALHRVNKG